jgi:hypothetical protein
MSTSDTCYYAVQHQTANEWEVGLGTYSANTITRTATLSSSNSNNPVTFSTGVKDVFITIPASKAVQVSSDGTTTLPDSSKVGSALIVPQGLVTGSGLTTAAGSRLVGRAAATAGALEEILVGTGLTLSSTAPLTLSSSGTVTSVTSSVDTATASGFTLTPSGTTSVAITFGISNPLTVRNTLAAAKSGPNTDITSLTGLTTALAVGQGGTGTTSLTGYVKGTGATAFASSATVPVGDISGTLPVDKGGTGAITPTAARTSLAAAASGANGDITSLTALSTALSVSQGGTGANIAATALTNLGAAASGLATASGLTSTANKLLGRAPGATGALQELTLGTGLSISGTTLNASSGTGEVNVRDFGAVPDGTTDCWAFFQNAINSLGARGGVVVIPPGAYYISDNLIVGDASSPFNGTMVTLRGAYGQPGQWNNDAATGIVLANVSSIRLAAGKTIRLMGSCGVENCLIYKNGFTPTSGAANFGTFTRVAPDAVTTSSTDAGAACRTAALANTAFYIEYSADTFIRNCMIMGFGLAVWGSNVARLRMMDVNIDCLNGVWLDHSSDISYINRVHCWPFSHSITGASIAASSTALNRAGSAFYTTRLNDWTKFTDCFSYGYLRGFEFSGGDEIIATGCGADNTGNNAGSTGFLLTGATNTTLSQCQAAGNQSGFYLEPPSATLNAVGTRMVHCDAWGNNDNGLVNTRGTLVVFGGVLRNNTTGIAISGGIVYSSGLGFKSNGTNVLPGSLTAMPLSYTF